MPRDPNRSIALREQELHDVVGVLDEALLSIIDGAHQYADDDSGDIVPELVLAMFAVRSAQRALKRIASEGTEVPRAA